MAKDYPYCRNAESSKLWPIIKEFFFCDADENLHWTDVAWMVGVGSFFALSVLVISL